MNLSLPSYSKNDFIRTVHELSAGKRLQASRAQCGSCRYCVRSVSLYLQHFKFQLPALIIFCVSPEDKIAPHRLGGERLSFFY